MEIRAAETSWGNIFWWCVLIYAIYRFVQEIRLIMLKRKEKRLFQESLRGECKVKPPCGG